MTRQRLKLYKEIREERDKLVQMIAELEAVMYGPRSPKLDGMPSAHGEAGRPTESLAIKHADLLELYEGKVADLAEILKDIEEAIKPLRPKERTLLRLYYIEGLTWEQVCCELHYSWSHVHRQHKAALEHLKELEDDTTCD